MGWRAKAKNKSPQRAQRDAEQPSRKQKAGLTADYTDDTDFFYSCNPWSKYLAEPGSIGLLHYKDLLAFAFPCALCAPLWRFLRASSFGILSSFAIRHF